MTDESLNSSEVWLVIFCQAGLELCLCVMLMSKALGVMLQLL